MKVLCHFHPVSLVFEGSIPTFACFVQKTFLTCSCYVVVVVVVVVVVFKSGKTEGRWERRQRGSSSTAILSTAVSSTFGSSNPVLCTIKFLISLFDKFGSEYNTV